MTAKSAIDDMIKPSSTAGRMGQESDRFIKMCVKMVFLIIFKDHNALKFNNNNKKIRN